jgi:P-type Cu2+ transporter
VIDFIGSNCRHCGLPVQGETADAGFCCKGCETVYELLHEASLTQYYELSRNRPPVTLVESPTDLSWLDEQPGYTAGEVRADIQGLHCAACVWLIESVFERQDGSQSILVNPALGTVSLSVDPRSFDYQQFSDQIQAFGYRMGPPQKTESRASSALLWRLGVSAALSMNVMLIAVAFYFGLSPGDSLYSLFLYTAFALTTLNVVIGGWPFLSSAFALLRLRALHLDLPIAIGIVTTYAGSTFAIFWGDPDATYLDSLSIFTTLMLAGRFLQTRTLENNRRTLLQEQDRGELKVTRYRPGRAGTESVAVSALREADTLLIAPGEIVPVDGLVAFPERTAVNLAWVTGESDLLTLGAGHLVRSGALNADTVNMEVVTQQLWSNSELCALLRSPPLIDAEQAQAPWLTRILRWYVPTLLGLAAATFATWFFLEGVQVAMEVATAVLVVTCPCAFGIAGPLARELALTQLRTRGVFVRSSRFFARICQITRVVFDKTGTLTLGRLSLEAPEQLDDLTPNTLQVLDSLVTRSAHPVSRAIKDALCRRAGPHTSTPRVEPATRVIEHSGEGLEWVGPEGNWRLGRAPFALDQDTTEPDTVLSLNGQMQATFQVRHTPRGDLRYVFSELQTKGFQLAVISGDAQQKVDELLNQASVQPAVALGDMSPADKAAWLASHDEDLALMVGDGLNDVLAFERAGLSATPALDRPGLPGRADFYFLGESLEAILAALHWGRRADRAAKRALTLALLYNAIVLVSAAFGGITPLLAALLMPTSSLVIIADTLRQLRPDKEATK